MYDIFNWYTYFVVINICLFAIWEINTVVIAIRYTITIPMNNRNENISINTNYETYVRTSYT